MSICRMKRGLRQNAGRCRRLVIPALYEPAVVERYAERELEEVLLHEAIGLGAALAYLEGGMYAVGIALEGQAEAEGERVVIDIGTAQRHMVFAIVEAEAVGNTLQVVVYAEGVGGICPTRAYAVGIGHRIDRTEVAELAPLHGREVEAGAPFFAVHQLHAKAVGHGQLHAAFGIEQGEGSIFLQSAAEVEVGNPVLVAEGAEILAEGEGAPHPDGEVGIELVLVLQAGLPVQAAYAGVFGYVGIDGVGGIYIGKDAGIAYGAEGVAEVGAEAEALYLAGKAEEGIVERAVAIVGMHRFPDAHGARGIVEVVVHMRHGAEAHSEAHVLAYGEAYGKVGQGGHTGAVAGAIGGKGG